MIAMEGAPATQGDGPASQPGSSDAWAGLNLPVRFQRVITDRALVDKYQLAHLQVEFGPPPMPVSPRIVRRRIPGSIQVFHSQVPDETLEYRSHLLKQFVPQRGFYAPILNDQNGWRRLSADLPSDKDKESAALDLIKRRLASDGLLRTMVGIIELDGPARYATNDLTAMGRLQAAGFPADLLACFAAKGPGDSLAAAGSLVGNTARRLLAGTDRRIVREELASLTFHVPEDWQRFEVAEETGTHEIGMVRMQLGGGYNNGITPGASIDVARQLVTALPKSDFVISIPEQYFQALVDWAQNTLPLVRQRQLKLIGEPLMLESWAQDNGKAGFVRVPGSGNATVGTVTPRYASREEGVSAFLPGESFAMDGLETAGHEVVHFPLLFQGGNLLPVRDPKSGRRLLLMNEGVVHRNVALGLTEPQILEVFRQCFGVDECVLLPTVSYHIDFDLNIRTVDGGLVAFVNDPLAAARAIVGLGIDTFERHGRLDHREASRLHYDLKEGDGALALKRAGQLARSSVDEEGLYGRDTAVMFRTSVIDSDTANLQVFLQALDVLESGLTADADTTTDPDRCNYLAALRRMRAAEEAQQEVLRSIGCRIVKVPSMPNLYRSINYLNGIHHPGGYLMPAYGGFYGDLDTEAEQVFHAAMGEKSEIVRIQCAQLQREQGAVHCAAAVYPASPAGAAGTPAL
jgi:hypothetical protein